MPFEKQEYQKRRAQLLGKMGEASMAILHSAPEAKRNGADGYYPYRQNSDFYYLTGFNEPEAVAVFVPGREAGEFILFNRERNLQVELWEGPRAGQEGACQIFGADQAFSFSTLDEKIPELMENCTKVYYPIARDMAFNRRMLNWYLKAQTKTRSGINAPSELLNIESILHEMRVIKSPYEIDCMRKAAQISANAHILAMKASQPGKMEYELEAEIQYGFTKEGSRSPAYNHIVGSGANSCVLHYNDNNKRIDEGDLVLIDAGAEYENYAADITRTFPANGRFSETQRIVYEIVLQAQLAVIDAVKPGVAWHKLQEMSEEMIFLGLINAGILSGDIEPLRVNQAWRRFYMHKFGHWLGLDVHDVGSYKVKNEWRLLEPGMVLTVEPGIYIPAQTEGIDEKWWNIGVRIEDDVLVTKEGNEVLSVLAPKTIEAIEELMGC